MLAKTRASWTEDSYGPTPIWGNLLSHYGGMIPSSLLVKTILLVLVLGSSS